MFGLKRFRVRIYYHEMVKEYLAKIFENIAVIIVKQQFTSSTKDFIILSEVQWKRKPVDIEAEFARLCNDIDALEAVTEITTENNRTLCYTKGVFNEIYASLFQFTTQEFLCFIEYPIILNKDFGEVTIIGLPRDFNRLIEFMRDFGSSQEIIAVKKYSTKDIGVLSVLTDKQLQLLKYAYHHGFFDHPRKRSAREISKGLGIAHTTFLTHIRKGQQRIFSALFGD